MVDKFAIDCEFQYNYNTIQCKKSSSMLTTQDNGFMEKQKKNTKNLSYWINRRFSIYIGNLYCICTDIALSLGEETIQPTYWANKYNGAVLLSPSHLKILKKKNNIKIQLIHVNAIQTEIVFIGSFYLPPNLFFFALSLLHSINLYLTTFFLYFVQIYTHLCFRQRKNY